MEGKELQIICMRANPQGLHERQLFQRPSQPLEEKELAKVGGRS